MTFFLTLGVFVAVGVAYAMGLSSGRHDAAAVKEHRAAAVLECMHALGKLEDEETETSARTSPAYYLGLREAQRTVVGQWLAEMEVETCPSVDAVAGVLADARREAAPEGAAVESVGPPRARSWLLNHPQKRTW